MLIGGDDSVCSKIGDSERICRGEDSDRVCSETWDYEYMQRWGF